MSEVKLVAESMQEFTAQDELNESAKEQLAKFIKNPSKKKYLSGAFARQLGKTAGLKQILLKMSDEDQLALAKQSYAKMEKDPKLGYPWILIQNRKIVGAGALPVRKSTTGGDLGQ